MKAILIDNEPSATQALVTMLQNYCPLIEISGRATSGEEGVELFNRTKPGLVFLDVEMPGMDGFETLEKLQPTSAAVIFVTGHQEYAERAFDFAAVDFLRKPVVPTRLIQAVHRASERHHLLHTQGQYQMLIELMNGQTGLSDKRQHRIAFATNSEIVYSWMNNLVRVDADGTHSFVKLIEQTGPLHLPKNLGEFERQFAGYEFMKKPHKSHLVNLYHVKKYFKEDQEILMSDNKRVPVSEGKKEEILRALRDLGIDH